MKQAKASRSRITVWMLGALLAVNVVASTACESQTTNPEKTKPAGSTAPADVQVGEAKFNANCVACHGARAVGTKQGPPLVHKIYEPNHHADVAFQRAAANGVRAH
ncbi:MAG: putative Cytochrome c, partial [Nitrospira sp.]|nr:putative Cytochrome c [Nitrospira sp.]